MVVAESESAPLLAAPWFADLTRLVALAQWQPLPSLIQLNRMLEAHGVAIRCIAQQDYEQQQPLPYYEQFIFDCGALPTREQNWHDLFNACIWALFPQTKTLLNRLHVGQIAQHGLKQRSPLRHLLTQFDECGVLLVSSDASLLEAARWQQWQRLFVEQRQAWLDGRPRIRAYLFGHGSYEALLNPFIGLCAKALCIQVGSDFFTQPLELQYRQLDQQVRELLSKADPSATLLSPLPLLGIPGWWPANEAVDFYDNADYFMPISPRRKLLLNREAEK